MNNNLNNFNSSSYNINNTNRFSPKQNSPRLNDTSNTISFASLNVRGINDICKFDDILDDLIAENISIIGLQETRLKESNAEFMFKNLSPRITQPFVTRTIGVLNHVIPPEESLSSFRLLFPNTYRKSIDMAADLSPLIYSYPPRKLKSLISTTINKETFSDPAKLSPNTLSNTLKTPAKINLKSSLWEILTAMLQYILTSSLKDALRPHTLASSNTLLNTISSNNIRSTQTTANLLLTTSTIIRSFVSIKSGSLMTFFLTNTALTEFGLCPVPRYQHIPI